MAVLSGWSSCDEVGRRRGCLLADRHMCFFTLYLTLLPTNSNFFYEKSMGYCETVCQLCGVSFAIARLRRADEPTEAGWSYYGYGFVDVDGHGPECDATGCQNVPREGVYGPGYMGAHDSGTEHLPTTGCVFDRGYNGHRISLEEMKGCRAVQSLLRKEATRFLNGQEWKAEPDDEDFELQSNYFLTGVGDGSPDESDLENLTPVRHGINSYYPCNVKYGVSSLEQRHGLFQADIVKGDFNLGLPFHPTCFGIFKRISKARLGRVDVHGLWAWAEVCPIALGNIDTYVAPDPEL